VSLAYLTETLPDPTQVRLAAAVAWRGTPTPNALHGGGGPFGWLREKQHRLWLRLGPLGIDLTVGGRPIYGGDRRAGYSIGMAAQPDGQPLAYYDTSNRVLRVLGRVVHVPRDLTLVALVDATGRRAAAPSLVLRTLAAPTIGVTPPEGLDSAMFGSVAYLVGGDEPSWTAALRADPVVRTFLDGP
jgi:hypothetical protein